MQKHNKWNVFCGEKDECYPVPERSKIGNNTWSDALASGKLCVREPLVMLIRVTGCVNLFLHSLLNSHCREVLSAQLPLFKLL